MDCHQHPGVAASGTCAGCAEAFCNNCLVTVAGARYCASCKMMAVSGTAAAAVMPAVECKEARECLTVAIVGLFCFGVILGPMAIIKGFKARQLCDDNPSLSGKGKATAAIIIGAVATAMWILGVVSQARGLSR